MALRLTQRFLVSSFLILGISSSAAAEEKDSFALPAAPITGGSLQRSAGAAEGPAASPPVQAQSVDGVMRLCETNGSRVRYSNLAIAGYQPCGALAVQRTCDPTGQRFFGAGNAPYSYLDCSRGPRIQISTDRQQPAPDSNLDPASDIATDLDALETKRSSLDALLDGSTDDPHSGGRSRGRSQSSGSDAAGLPFDMRTIEKVLRTVQSRNQELLQILDDQ